MGEQEEAAPLRLSIERDVEPSEVTSLVFGTGALIYPWWGTARWMRDGKRVPSDSDVLRDALVQDKIVLHYDRQEDEEGTLAGRKTLTLQQIVDAAGTAIRKGYVYEKDAIGDDLGYCDAEQADIILQFAVFEVEEPVYG